MVRRLDRYRDIVGDKIVDRVEEMAAPFSEKHIVHMNSSYYGGGVAEILSSMVLVMNELGIETGWRLLKGSPDFFAVTKKFHNALHGEGINLSKRKKQMYLDENRENAEFTHIENHHLMIVHDPQPLPIINFYRKKAPWLWRCHIDISNPNMELWNYLKQFIVKYDSMIVSAEKYKKGIGVPQRVIPPSIDPLNQKNVELKDSVISKYLKKFNIPADKPIISQVSRFDKWKDPLGVIDAFRLAQAKADCRLVLLGDFATDDPEGQMVYDSIIREKGRDEDIIVINQTNDILANVVQRASSVVVQKSLKEGFGLTVSEALWKGTPVVAGRVGGIPMQLRNGRDGYLVNSAKECADRIVRLLKNPKLARKMGASGREHVRKNFLTPRHIGDYLGLFKDVF